jgi:hypothetical protein
MLKKSRIKANITIGKRRGNSKEKRNWSLPNAMYAQLAMLHGILHQFNSFYWQVASLFCLFIL